MTTIYYYSIYKSAIGSFVFSFANPFRWVLNDRVSNARSVRRNAREISKSTSSDRESGSRTDKISTSCVMGC